MRSKILLISVLFLLVLPLTGCEVIKDATGKKTVRVDPNAAAKVEGAAEAGVGILQSLAVIWPGLAVGAGGLATALAAWRKAKTKLVTKQSEADAYYNATAAVVAAIEDFKKTHPTTWKKLKLELEDKLGPGATNIIWAIRGYPPKK